MERVRIVLLSLILLVSVPQLEPTGSVQGRTWSGYDLEFNETFMVNASTGPVTWENLSVLCGQGIGVIDHLTIKNSTVVVENIGITNGGHISLINSSLMMKDVGILNYGYLNATDLDGDADTPDDSSRILFLPSGAPSSTIALQGVRNVPSSLTINRSYIQGFDLTWGKLEFEDVRMLNCTIKNMEWGSAIDGLDMKGSGTGTAIIPFYSTPMTRVSISNYGKGAILLGRNVYKSFSVSNCTVGLDVRIDKVTLIDSRLINNSIQLVSSQNLSLIDTQVEGGRIELSSTSTSTIHGSTFRNMVTVKDLSNGVVRDSEFIDCDKGLEDPFNSIITRSRFIGNKEAIDEGEDSRIFYNSFIDNEKVATGPPLSTWYNSTSLEGNYYDSYTGEDDGSNGRKPGDGIGDTDIPFLARDPYPLMMDRYWDMPDIPKLGSSYERGSDRVDLSWTDEGSRYIVQRSNSKDFSSKLVSWSTRDAFLPVYGNENTTQYFRVRAYNDVGSKGWSNTTQVDVDQKPLPPGNFRLEPIPEGKAISLEWDWVGEDLYRALIYVKKGQTEFNPIIVYYPDNAIIVRGLQNGEEYSFRMVSIDHAGSTSDSTDIIKGIPVDIIPPGPPRNIEARARGNNTLVIEWDPPLTQDIWGYIIYRRDPGDEDFKEITRLSRSVPFYEDMGLSDNTTYEYVMASVDDDGPVSELSGIIFGTTAHNNQRPIFGGSELVLYMVEDEGPLYSDLLNDFEDPDGDELMFAITEYFPFKATIADGLLWIVPEEDQAGEGYVQISVSDGEEKAFYLIGVIVEPVEDPPRDVSIVQPVNGSVLLPGSLIVFEASGYDPDMPNGDILNVTWTSDKDGVIHISTQSIMRTVRDLSPGEHRIDLKVEDRAGNVVFDTIYVIVSLWGWGDMPWRAVFSEPERNIDTEIPYLEITLENDSPLILRFTITGEVGTMSLPGERNIMIGPRSNGRITIELPEGLKLDEELLIALEIEAQTLNGTYGGTMNISDMFRIVSNGGRSSGERMMIIVISIVSAIALIGLGGYLFFTFRVRRDRKGD
ncbi:MAG: fibronectin type III domain-containing protein [Thermoplasmatota archaeon]